MAYTTAVGIHDTPGLGIIKAKLKRGSNTKDLLEDKPEVVLEGQLLLSPYTLLMLKKAIILTL